LKQFYGLELEAATMYGTL